MIKVDNNFTAAMAFTLAGCTSSSDTTTDTNTGTTTTSSTPSTEKQGHFDHPVEIEFKSTLSYTDQIQTLIDDFKDINASKALSYLKKAKDLVTTLLTEINDLLSDEKNHFDNTKELIAKLANRTW